MGHAYHADIKSLSIDVALLECPHPVNAMLACTLFGSLAEVWRTFGGSFGRQTGFWPLVVGRPGRFLAACGCPTRPVFESFFGRFLAATDHNQEKRATCNDLPFFGRLRQK